MFFQSFVSAGNGSVSSRGGSALVKSLSKADILDPRKSIDYTLHANTQSDNSVSEVSLIRHNSITRPLILEVSKETETLDKQAVERGESVKESNHVEKELSNSNRAVKEKLLENYR